MHPVTSFPYLVGKSWISHCFRVFRAHREASTLEFLHERFNERENLLLGRVSRDACGYENETFFFLLERMVWLGFVSNVEDVVLNVSVDFEYTSSRISIIFSYLYETLIVCSPLF